MIEPPLPAAAADLVPVLLETLQASGALVSLKEADSGRYLWANARCVEFLRRHGLPGAPDWRGATDLELLPLNDATAVRAADQRALHAGMPSAGEHRFERSGEKLEWRTLRQVVAPADGGAMLVLGLWWDDGPARRAADQIKLALAQVERQQGMIEALSSQQRGSIDRPTELFRREQFEEHLRREWALSTREHREFALVLLAVDAPASGVARPTPAAELLARTVAQMLRANTRAMDVISHLADGRLAVLLSGVGLATAHTRMEQIRRQCVTHMVVHEGTALPFTVSVGIASFPHTADTLEGLSGAAERSLVQAEQRGGNRVVLATIPLDAPKA